MLPYIDIPFRHLSRSTGASVDELKLISSFLLSYPLAGALKNIPDAKRYQKNLFIICVAIFYLIGLFDLYSGIQTILISSVGAYAIASFVDSPFMPWIGFIFLMGHMSLSHIERQFVDSPDRVDITGAQMVLVMKLTAFCWNVQDGRLPEKELEEFQSDHAIRQIPDILDFAGYVLFFPSLFAGPSFDYVDYQRWITAEMFTVPPGISPAEAPKLRKNRKTPRSGIPAAMKAITGLTWIFLFLQFNKWYNTEVVLDDSFLKYGFIRRIWLLQMLGFSTRLKYYGVWTLTEGACILSGLGYRGINPKTRKVEWNRLQNVNPWGIETAQNSRAFLEGWNMNTNNWLKNYMYLRVTPKGKKPGFQASLVTFATSALWHGFHPGYYLTFVLAAFIQTEAKNFRRYLRPLFMEADGQKPGAYKTYYDFVTYLITQAMFCFTTAPFVILSLSDSLKVWSRVYFYAIAAIAASMVFFASPGKVWLVQQQKRRTRPAATQITSHDSSENTMPGLPGSPRGHVDEPIREIETEIRARGRGGASVTLPAGSELKVAVDGS